MLMLTIQILASAALVLAVFWWMWRLPSSGSRFFGWGPPLALMSAWMGLIALAVSCMLWFLPYPDRWVATTFLILDPGAITCGALVLWIYRGNESEEPTIAIQRTQAKVGITLGILAVVVGYTYVMMNKPPDVLTGG